VEPSADCALIAVMSGEQLNRDQLWVTNDAAPNE